MADKRVLWFYDFLSTLSTDENVYLLTEQQTQMLVAALPQMTWDSRWHGTLPSLDWRMEISADIDYRLQTPVNVCQLFIDCIQNDPDTQAELIQFLVDNGYGQNGGGTGATPLEPSILGENLIDPSASCTDENRYGMARALYLNLNRVVDSMLAQLEVITNDFEYGVIISDNFEAISATVGTVGETAAWLQDNIAEEFEAAKTLAVEEAISCALYCQITNCELNFDEIYEAYQTELGISIPDINDLQGTLTFLQNILLGSDILVVGVMHLVALAAMRFGSNFFSLGDFSALAYSFYEARNATTPVPSGCNCVTELCYEWDFTIDAQGWTIWTTNNRPFGVYVAGIGWQCTWNNVSGAGFDNRIYIENRGMTGTFNSIRYEIDVISTAGGSSRNGSVRGLIGNTLQGAVNFPAYNVGTTETLSVDLVQASLNGIMLNFVTDTNSDDQDALTIVRLRLYYASGGTPEDGNPC